ncbi:MAG: hypothetical protein ACTHV7_04735 [Oleiphilaceae bacterium]
MAEPLMGGVNAATGDTEMERELPQCALAPVAFRQQVLSKAEARRRSVLTITIPAS